MNQYDVIIVGGGASGFFSVLNIAEKCPDLKVAILEKTSKLLSKVKVSGGGRCNVTHHCFEVGKLVKNYPRGEKKLYKAFKEFGPEELISWFSQRNVELKVEQDGRMFPESNSSQTVIDCFLKEAKKLHVEVLTSQSVKSIHEKEGTYMLETNQEQFVTKYLVIAPGSNQSLLPLFKELGYKIEPPVPSLFTFNIKDQRLQDLPGVAFKNTYIKVNGTKLQSEGPLLITHWGLSGPGILRLSAWGARELADLSYHFEVRINFTGLETYDQVREALVKHKQEHGASKVAKNPLFEIPKRFWFRLMEYLEISDQINWSEFPKKSFNKLVEELAQGVYRVSGKSTFKDEFVTCGGISLTNVDMSTLESRLHSNLFFTGEFLDIDAITGGFNFQACWSTAWLVSEEMRRKVTS